MHAVKVYCRALWRAGRADDGTSAAVATAPVVAFVLHIAPMS